MVRAAAVLCTVCALFLFVPPPAPSQAACGRPLQALVDAARPGTTVRVPACVYRESILIAKPLTLIAAAGAEIRGSDVWADGWGYADGLWTHAGMPVFPDEHFPCAAGTGRCNWPEQVFLDGKPLLHVADRPAAGQFAVDASRTLVLADDPREHTVEVATRPRWVTIRASNVTVIGFRMRHTANPASSGAIEGGGPLESRPYSSITIDSNVLSDTAGPVMAFSYTRLLKVTRNDIGRGGQLGIGLSTVTDSLVQGNRIHDNNTARFAPGWEAGGLKASSRIAGLVVDNNEVDHNYGPGLWCDGSCSRITFSRNRVHDNGGEGILHEISHNAAIFANVVWNNGSIYGGSGWGAGIMVSNSDSCDVHDNILAWNANGITVVDRGRTDNGVAHPVFDTHVHHNTIIMLDNHHYALGWLSSRPPEMFEPRQHNRGSANRFGYGGKPESNATRFAWSGDTSSLAVFDRTPGGGGDSRYLIGAEETAALRSAGILRLP